MCVCFCEEQVLVIDVNVFCLFQQDSLHIEQHHRHELPRHEVSKVFNFEHSGL